MISRVGVTELFVVLGFLEIGQHIAERPAAISRRCPVVIVEPVPAHVDHAVDRARSAQHLAARNIDRALRSLFLFGGPVAPIELTVVHQKADGERNVDQGVAVTPARFDQANAHAGILAQAVGQNTARRAGANDDVIERIRPLRRARIPHGNQHPVHVPEPANPNCARCRKSTPVRPGSVFARLQ